MYVDALPADAQFDFIVCGAGSAGCIVAERLSKNGRHAVLLIEAGGRDDSLNIKVPLLVVNLINNPEVTWPYMTEAQRHLNGKPQRWTRGRVIGGSGSINGNLFARGDPAEYDHWVELGCPGWGYADMLPVFKRMEDFPQGDPALRGRGGPIHCTRLDRFDKLSGAFVKACTEAGYRELPDYNDGSYEGAFYLQYSTRKGFRNNSAAGYLRPARKRSNLTILPNTTVSRLVMEGRTAVGVELLHTGGAISTVRARQEVILSAGPLATPPLLERSGIGQEAVLRQHGIPVLHHLPGVGENLRDHPNTRLTFECSEKITVNDVLRSPLRKMREGLRFIFKREGLLTISSSTAQMNYRSSPDKRQADLVLRLQPLSGGDRYARTPGTGMDMFPGFTFGVTTLQPKSIGTLHIRSTDPREQASMDPRYLSNEEDAQLFLRGMRISRGIAAMPALTPLVVRETRPGPGVVDDADMLAYIRETLQTSWHMVGTCKMGTDGMAVVDPQLRVHGIERLRVIDSSICPTLPSSGTAVPTMAIAEKGAEMVLSAHP